MPKVSVIIPTYNRLHTLERAVQSVLSQTFEDWELWLVDDGSSDGTAQWVKQQLAPRMGHRLQFLQSTNKGVSHARNLAIQASNGPWLAFLDSDDEWLPEKLQKQLALAETSGLPLIHGEEIWIRNGVRVNPKKKHQKSGGRLFSNSLRLCCISPSTSLLSRSILDQVGGFREDFPVCEDYELWLRVTSRFEVGFVKDPVVVKYGGHEDQLSRKFHSMDYWRVKAMTDHLQSPWLNPSERQALLNELRKKANILLKGYQKHQNFSGEQEVKQILETLPDEETRSSF